MGLSDSVLVDVEVDDQGHFVDYQVISGASAVSDPTIRRRVENLLYFTKFAPATAFGMPMAGKSPRAAAAQHLDFQRRPFRLARNLRKRLKLAKPFRLGLSGSPSRPAFPKS